jgi:hypothetical protein
MTSEIASNRVEIRVVWTGANTWSDSNRSDDSNTGRVDLVMRDVQTEISVNLPEGRSSGERPLRFTCRRYSGTGDGPRQLQRETHPESLALTAKQVENFSIRVSWFKRDYLVKPLMVTTFKVQMPRGVEMGETYKLVLSLNSASLIKQEVSATSLPRAEETTPTNPSVGFSPNLNLLSTKQLERMRVIGSEEDSELDSQFEQARANLDIGRMRIILDVRRHNRELLADISKILERRGAAGPRIGAPSLEPPLDPCRMQ